MKDKHTTVTPVLCYSQCIQVYTRCKCRNWEPTKMHRF